MPFDHKYYNAVKRITEINIFRYHVSPLAYKSVLQELYEKEDYEAIKAIKEVIVKWMIRNAEYYSQEDLENICLFT